MIQYTAWTVIFAVLLVFSVVMAYVGTQQPQYIALKKAAWFPKFWFAVVIYLIAYGLAAIGFYLAYKKINAENEDDLFLPILLVGVIYYFVYILWLVCIFYSGNLYLGLVFIVITLLLDLYYTYLMFKIDYIAGVLQIPQLLVLILFVAYNVDLMLHN